MIGNVKLGVEVVSANNLLPKDGEGTSNAFVELHFDSQLHRTTVKEKDLNPQWNERFSFTVSDPANLPNLTLEAYVYHDVKPSHSRSLLGRVRLHSSSFVPQQDAVTLSYPLEKKNILSRARGELSLRVYLLDDHLFHHVQPSIPFVTEPVAPAPAPMPVVEPAPVEPRKGHNHRDTHQFYSLPNQHSAQEPPPRVVINHDEAKPVPPSMVRVYNSNAGAGGIPFIQTMPSSSGEFSLKETSPLLGGGQVIGGRVIRGSEKPVGTYDLVEEMRYLFVRVVKAQDLPSMDVTGSCDPYVEVKLGNYKATTRHFEKNTKPEWNEVFAFSRERLQSSVVEVVVKDKDMIKDDFIGRLRLDINEMPVRMPPDSPLAPEWYRLEKKDGEKLDKGELMLAVWIGTQADESFPEAWHSDAIPKKDGFHISNIRSKVYHSPRLWYLRLHIIEAQDLYVKDKTRYPEVYVKAQLGNQTLKTRFMQSRNFSPVWNEEHMFVAAEPFEDHLVLTIEDRVGPNKDETIGKCSIPLSAIDKRANADDRLFKPRWCDLERPGTIDPELLKKDKFATRLHIRVCFDGGYHVLDESTHYSSDLRPTAKQLWKPSIGVLELGILNAQNLHPVKTRDGKGVSDTFCVAKYGQKWVRTRTIIDDPSPKWNEQYTWEVYDACTVLTVGVFDNCHTGSGDKSNGHKDLRVGKVRIRLSTLEAGRVYTHSYPLMVLHPSGVKKMGEIHLAIRFSCTSTLNIMCTYARPLLPKMHYVRPLSIHQVDTLRHHAVSIVAARLGRAEPPLRKEVVEYMSDVDSHMWSMRRSKANFFRLIGVFSGLMAVAKWFGEVCAWTNPVTAVLVHLLFVILVCFPELIFPTAFLYMLLIGIWNYRYRARHPPHMDTKISYAEAVHPDELDEEFDTFPTGRSAELVRMRYDRLRSVAGRIQTVVGDVATQGERLHSLLSWRDPRATTIFLAFCFCAAMVLYVTPFQVVLVALGFYQMRHPRFRHRLPSSPLNFFRRLPAKTDSLL